MAAYFVISFMLYTLLKEIFSLIPDAGLPLSIFFSFFFLPLFKEVNRGTSKNQIIETLTHSYKDSEKLFWD